jgi:L-fuculose-phosphate aldolase
LIDERRIREEICEIGRRVYARQFSGGNAGNISCRMSDDVVICTPTLICKGFMTPDDLCTVDMTGKQLSGARPTTSETPLHLEVYKRDPSVSAVIHCHPPHATAFAVTHEEVPTGILPEVEVFLGVVPRAEYATPGSEEFARTVLPFVGKANTVLLSNHGTLSWASSLERAFWQTEVLDSYCHILILGRQIGGIERIPERQVAELLELKEKYGAGADARLSGGGELYVNPDFGRRPGGGRSSC